MKLLSKRTWTDAQGRKHTAWVLDVYHPVTGERIRETIKGQTKRAEAEKVAEARWAAIQLAAARGVAGPAGAEGAELTLGNLLVIDDDRPGIAPRTRHGERAQSARLSGALDAGLAVTGITRAAVIDYQRRRTAEGCGPRGVNAEVGKLRAAVNRALDAGWLEVVPCRWPPRLPESPKAKRALTLPELRALVEACPPALADVVTVLGYTGIRPVELWRIVAADWHAGNATLTVRNLKRGAGANYSTRSIYCLPVVAEVIARRAAGRAKAGKPAAPLFGTLPAERIAKGQVPKQARGHMHGEVFLGDHGFADALRGAAAVAGLTHPETVTPYALRHTYATLFPGDLRDLQYSLGHSDIATTARYRKAVESRTRAALELMHAGEHGHTVATGKPDHPSETHTP